MTAEHNSDNMAEVKRILSEHPKEEERDIIRGDRLLGILAPLRAFGDFKFKWPEETINEVWYFFRKLSQNSQFSISEEKYQFLEEDVGNPTEKRA